MARSSLGAGGPITTPQRSPPKTWPAHLKSKTERFACHECTRAGAATTADGVRAKKHKRQSASSSRKEKAAILGERIADPSTSEDKE